jgi:hypothetical protein
VFSILDLNLSEERRVAFVLVGSSPTGLEGMTRGMRKRSKGADLLDRVPQMNRFEVEPLVLEDRLVVFASQAYEALGSPHDGLLEIEKFAAYYLLQRSEFDSPRQIRELAVATVPRLPKNDRRIRYDDLFVRGDGRNQSFWALHQQAAEHLAGSFIVVER